MATVIIKPKVDRENDSIGLAPLGLNSFPGTVRSFQVPIKNGKFLTGYDENAFYIAGLPENKREKERNRIRQECEILNKEYPHLQLCDCSLNNEFYKNLVIEISAGNTIFDTNNINDIVKLNIIRTNAMYSNDSIIAPTFQDALDSNRDYKFYISDEDRDVEIHVNKKRELNRAIGKLDDLAANDKSKLLLVIKYLLKPNKMYNTDSDARLYKKMDDFINGVIDDEKTKDDTASVFIKAANTSRDELIAKVTIKYADYLNIIRKNKEKVYVFQKLGLEVGRTPEEVYNYMINTKHSDVYNDLMSEVEKEIKIY